jgi:phosphate transport system permease protein
MAVTQRPVAVPGLPPGALKGNLRRRAREAVIKYLFFAAAVASIVISVLILWSLVSEAWTFISQVDWSALTTIGWFPRRGLYDLGTLIVASIIVTGIAMLIAVPMGLLSAIYLSEYARPRVRKVVKPILEILAGIPSVVLGFFALQWISPNVIQNIWSSAGPQTLAAAGVGVGILTIPLMASVSEDAMSAVPGSLREASVGMGARKVTTTLRVVIPAAISGLTAAFIISVSRGMGETMVVFIAGGGGDGALFTTNPLDPGLTMTAAMASVATGTDNVVGEGLTFQSLYFVGFLLFVITLGLNLVADVFVRRIRNVY